MVFSSWAGDLCAARFDDIFGAPSRITALLGETVLGESDAGFAVWSSRVWRPA